MIFEHRDHIVFAGDSVTDMGSEYPVGENVSEALGRSYVRIIDNMLGAWYPERSIRISNSGCGGNTSKDLLERWERDVINLKPDWVSICIGINDVWHQFDVPYKPTRDIGPEQYYENVEKMIVSVKDNVKGMFMCSPYYIEPNREDMIRRRMDEYVAVSKELADKYSMRFVDFQALYEKYASIRHSSFICWDRVHPNQVGATLMAREFLKQCDFDYDYNALK